MLKLSNTSKNTAFAALLGVGLAGSAAVTLAPGPAQAQVHRDFDRFGGDRDDRFRGDRDDRAFRGDRDGRFFRGDRDDRFRFGVGVYGYPYAYPYYSGYYDPYYYDYGTYCSSYDYAYGYCSY